ncbi:hypothetical protein BBJ28_00026053 [Nothophytophthora sp. Chile5]|nr:hypothetical protein BBJ28_00026053 [Nothophytophthora sp. Chile5]
MGTMALEKHSYALFNGRYEFARASPHVYQSRLTSWLLPASLLLVAPFQIHTAASRALLCDASGRLTTRSLHAELVFNLSGSRNVSESFRRFGISDACTSVVLCVFDADDATLKSTETLVEGSLLPFSEVGTHLRPEDVKLIKKYYKIQDQELTCSSLVDAVTCRIATKSCNK